jgi:hypothetical protein
VNFRKELFSTSEKYVKQLSFRQPDLAGLPENITTTYTASFTQTSYLLGKKSGFFICWRPLLCRYQPGFSTGAGFFFGKLADWPEVVLTHQNRLATPVFL